MITESRTRVYRIFGVIHGWNEFSGVFIPLIDWFQSSLELSLLIQASACFEIVLDDVRRSGRETYIFGFDAWRIAEI